MPEIQAPPIRRNGGECAGEAGSKIVKWPAKLDVVLQYQCAAMAACERLLRHRAMRGPDAEICVLGALRPIEHDLPAQADGMEMRGGAGGAGRLFHERNAISRIDADRRRLPPTATEVACRIRGNRFKSGMQWPWRLCRLIG